MLAPGGQRPRPPSPPFPPCPSDHTPIGPALPPPVCPPAAAWPSPRRPSASAPSGTTRARSPRSGGGRWRGARRRQWSPPRAPPSRLPASGRSPMGVEGSVEGRDQRENRGQRRERTPVYPSPNLSLHPICHTSCTRRNSSPLPHPFHTPSHLVHGQLTDGGHDPPGDSPQPPLVVVHPPGQLHCVAATLRRLGRCGQVRKKSEHDL